MKISNQKPPVWDECRKTFDFGKGTVFTYGDTLFNPDNVMIPDHLMVHEETHARQQEHNDHVASVWWKRYMVDVPFRISQEVEAYGNQYRFICEKVKDRNAKFKNLHMLSEFLAGPMYGNAISYTDAMRRIKEAALSTQKDVDKKKA